MRDTTWQELIEDLKDKERKKHLDPARAKLPTAGPRDELMREMLQEMAAAFGRANEKVTTALLQLDECERAIDAVALARPHDVRAINARIDAFNAQHDATTQSVWELQVHREALGFRTAPSQREQVPLPPKRARR